MTNPKNSNVDRMMYIRDDKRNPIGCLVIKDNSKTSSKIHYQMSVTNPVEDFDRKFAVDLAEGRLVIRPNVIDVKLGQVSALHDVVSLVMRHIVDTKKVNNVPSSAVRYAKKWLVKDKAAFDCMMEPSTKACRYIYLRDPQRNPVGCAAVFVDRQFNQVRYNLSIGHTNDDFSKEKARNLATNRLNSYPIILDIDKAATMHDITMQIMNSIIVRNPATKAVKAAKRWKRFVEQKLNKSVCCDAFSTKSVKIPFTIDHEPMKFSSKDFDCSNGRGEYVGAVDF